jgi:hypothetical protein
MCLHPVPDELVASHELEDAVTGLVSIQLDAREPLLERRGRHGAGVFHRYAPVVESL